MQSFLVEFGPRTKAARLINKTERLQKYNIHTVGRVGLDSLRDGKAVEK
jgi:hypothetical protein